MSDQPKEAGRRGAHSASPGWFTARATAFVHAGRGLLDALKTQPNFQIHTAVTGLVVVLGLTLGISSGDWIALLLCIATVLAAELINTALESLADAFSTERHPLIGRAKDTAAAAVLVLSLNAAIIGTIIFWRHLFPD